MKKTSLKFLEDLCNAPGVAGFEREATRVAKRYIEKHCDAISCDKIGSLAFSKTGAKKGPVIFLPGHVDEIGFIVSGIHESGYLKFHALGGWPDQVLLNQRVKILTKKGVLPGVIASKPIHLMTAEERAKLVPQRDMFIDIFCSNLPEAQEMGVRVGDVVVPDSTFYTVEKTVFKDGKSAGRATIGVGKAFDNRAGLFIAVEVLRRLAEENIKHPNTVVAAATVMEEVGCRGAVTSAYQVNPDVCIALDVAIAGDVPGIEKHQAQSGLGRGVAISCFDGGLIPNQILKELVIETAEAEKIPHVLVGLTAGTTDASAVHKSREGCPSITLGIPTRHIHSHVGALDLADLEACIDLTLAVVKRLDAKTVESLTRI